MKFNNFTKRCKHAMAEGLCVVESCPHWDGACKHGFVARNCPSVRCVNSATRTGTKADSHRATGEADE